MTAGDIAAGVRTGQISAAVVVDAHLARVAETNPELGALVSLREPGARSDADAIDALVAGGGDPGPLAGVPFTVKDVIATRDLPTTCGSRALVDQRPGSDAPAVARLRRAGAVLIGKSNTPEFAFGVDTVNALYGRTRNPLGHFTIGGSSGGEAAAVASGMSAFGVGTDFGGSLRWPAQCAELVGLRPSIGAVPPAGQFPITHDEDRHRGTLQELLQTIGPIARTVSDSRLVLSVLTGSSVGDPDRVASLSDVEIQYGTTVAGYEPDSDIREAVETAADVFAGLGARVVRGLPEALHEAVAVYAELRASDSLRAIREAIAGREQLVEARTRMLLADTLHAAESPRTLAGWDIRDQLVADLGRVLRDGRVLLLPVSTASPAEQDVDDFMILVPSRAVSLFGFPAVSVPWARTDDGRPCAVQLVGPPGADDLLLEVAEVLEVAGRWAPA